MALSSRSQRFHKAISLLLLFSLILGQVLSGATIAAAQSGAPAAEQVAAPAAEQATQVAPSALPPTLAVCAAPAAQVYLPILFGAGGGQAPANRAPWARPCRVTAAAGSGVAIDLGGVIRDQDGDPVSVSLPGQPGHGAAAVAGLTLHYTPTAGFAGVEQFAYAMSDGRGGAATGQVIVTVQAAANQPPAASAVVATVATTGTATIDLSMYASDPDGDALAYAIAEQPGHGSAALSGSVLTYTPTTGFSGTDTLRYSATDPAGASASARITVLVRPVGPQANQAPFTQPYTATAATTATLEFDLDLLAMDPDGDPLAFELLHQPAQGAASLISHTLRYTPARFLSGPERLTYLASDDHGHAVTGTITLLPVATRLHVTPGAALLTAPGQSAELTVKAYNGQGVEIGLDGLDLEWVSTQPLSVSVAPAAGGASATVTGLVAAGSATVVVRSASDPSVVSALVAVTVAGVKPGVQLLGDERIVFPLANPIPNRAGSPYPAGPDGQPIIGAFSEAEVAAAFEVVGDYRTDAPVTSFKYPLVLSGGAPAVGSVLLASQSAPLMGRVSRVVAERGGFALVQVELLTFTDVFSDFDWSFDIASLLEAGLATPEQFIGARAATPGLGGLRRELAAPFSPSAPVAPQALGGACDLSKIFSFVGVEGKVLSPNINFTPVYDGILQSGRFPEGDSYVRHFKILLGFEASLDLSMSVKFQPGVQFALECEIGDGFELELPNTGFLALINLLLGPELEVGPKFETGLKMQGLVSFAIGASLKFALSTAFGYEYRNPTGFDGKGNWIKKFEPTSELTPFMNGFDGASEAMQGKFEFTAGIVEGAEGNFVLGGGIWDVLEFFSGDRARELREKLTLRFIEGKAGLQLKLEWGTPHQVLAEKGNYSPAFNLNFIAEGVVKASTFGKALEKLLIFNALIDIKVFEVAVPLAPLYKPLEKTTIEVTPAGKTKPGETLEFKAALQNGIPGVSPTRGALYHDGRKLADLSATTPGLKGEWKVDAQTCAAAEASETGSVTLDVLGWNTMPNQPLGQIPLPSIIPTPSYVGSVELKCSEFSFTLTSTPDLQNLPDGTLNGCYVPGRTSEVRVPFQLVARHDGGLLDVMDIHVDRPILGPDPGIIIGPSSASGNGVDTKDLKIEATMRFLHLPDEDDLLDEDFTIHAKVRTRAVDGQSMRTKEIHFDFDLHWADCTEPLLTMEAAVAPAAQDDGAVYACTNTGESQGSVTLTIAGRDEAAKIDRIELVGRVTPNDHILFRKTIPGVAGQKTLNGVQTMTISRFDVGFDSAATAAIPAHYTVEATIYALDDDNLPTRTKTVEYEVDVYWGTCETITERELRTRTPGCQIITEQREIKTILYKMWFHNADQVIKEKEFEPTPWVFLRSTQTDDCSRPPANTRGDPHIVTPDGLQYDSMALGEFTYLRPLPGEQGMTIQVRQERLGDVGTRIFFPWASWNTAVAIEAGGQTFEFWIDKFIGDPFITWGSPRLHRPRVNGQILNLTPGLYSYGEVDLNVRSDRAIQLTYQGRTVMINHVVSFLELSVSVPLDNTHHGMLGTPNGNVDDDFRYPDGLPARDGFDMADAWRITDPAASLFTYKPGEGPHTFNLEQINQPPSSAELAPYVDQARELLLSTCSADSLSQVAVNNTAMELMTGREPRELAGSGLCWYSLSGQVTNSLVPGLPVPGARVVITSPQLETCETYTDRQGNYRCDLPAAGELPTLTATVSGRGQGSATVSMTALPPMEGYLPARLDLAVAPTTLHLSGAVRDILGRPLYNAQLRLTGPAGAGFGKAYAQTDGDGAYSAYLMLDDGASAGATRYDLAYSPSWSTDPDAVGVSQTFTRTLPAVQANALNPISETLTLTGSLVRFSGRVSYQQAAGLAVAGARVRVLPTAPVAGWTICDELTGLDGSYACEIPLSVTEPFQVNIEVDGQRVAGPITVDPAGSGVGEVIPVITNVQIPSGLLRVGGLVRDPSGAPLAGATVKLSTDATFGGATAISDASGRYTATLGLFPGKTVANATYRVSYGLLDLTRQTTWEGLDSAVANERAYDLTLGGSRLMFSGRLSNAFAPGAALPASTVVISSGTGLLCEADDVRSTYACTVDLAAHGDADLRVEYALSGPWGSHHETVLLTSLPAAGESRTLVRDFVLPLTTARLQGSVRTSAGAPLAGATVRVASGPAVIEGKTAADGAYDLLLTLPEGQSVRDLDYTVQYRTALIRQTKTIEAAPSQLTVVRHDVTYDQRPLYFRGKLSNPFGIPMPASQVVIAAAPLAAPCVTQTAPDGSYLCVTQSQASAPFSATFSLSGFWGSQVFTQTVAAAADQPALEHAADFQVSPTVLRLHGVVAAPSGQGLAGVEVTAGGAATYREARATTDQSGAYALYVFVRPAAADVFTTTLSVRVGYGSAVRAYNVPVAATKNSLTEISRDFTLDGRVIRFHGAVLNGLVQGMPINGSRVLVSAAGEGRLCEWNSIDRATTNRYSCDAVILDDQPFEVLYTLVGPWGSAAITGTVASLPDVGGLGEVERNLLVSPTTIRLSGQVQGRAGAPLANARLLIAAPELAAPLRLSTDEAGAYSGMAVLRADALSATLSYTVEAAGLPGQSRAVSVTALAGGLAAHEESFVFATARAVVLQGAVRNTTLESLALNGRVTIVSPSADEALCSVTLSDGKYRCSALVSGDGDFTVNYRIEGDWGQIVLQNQTVPAGAAAFTQDFDAAPTVLRFVGTVAGAAPLAGAQVSVSSYDLVPGLLSRATAVSDGSGAYATAIVLGQGVSNGTLIYRAVAAGNSASVQRTFALSGTGGLHTIEQDLALTTRTVNFTGQIINTVAPDAALPVSRLVISSAEHGRMCEATVSGSSRFSCSVSLGSAAPFTATYALSGEWGSSVFSLPIANLPAAGGQTTLDIDVPASPAMLRVRGRVRDGSGADLPQVGVRAEGSWVAAATTGLSDDEGRYELLVILKDSPLVQAGSLRLTASKQGLRASAELPFMARPGALTEIDAEALAIDFDLAPRALVIEGNLLNANVPEAAGARPTGRISVLAPDGGQWCPTVQSSTFVCSLTLYSAEPVDVVVRAEGDWGVAERRLRVTAIPAPGETGRVRADVEVVATALRLRGRVVLPDGRPLAGAHVAIQVRAEGRPLGLVSQRTDANGLYDGYVFVPAGYSQLTLGAHLIYQEIPLDITIHGVTVRPNVLNERQDTFTFTKRRVRFTGTLTNALVPGMAVPGLVSITTPDIAGGAYCESVVQARGGTFACDAYVRTDAPFSVNYHFSGAWGELDVQGAVAGLPEAGGSLLVERHATASPTTIRMIGTVTDPAGKPLDGAALTIATANPGNPGAFQPLELEIGASGRYTASAILNRDVVAGNVSYRIRYFSARQTEIRPYDGLRLNQLNDVVHNFEVSSRVLNLEGQVEHALAPGLNIRGRLYVTSPVYGTLCNQLTSQSATYRCAIPAVTTEPFTLTYALVGDWGDATWTAEVPAGQTGASTLFTKDLLVSPLVLRLRGVIRDAQGQPLPGVGMAVLGSDLSGTSATAMQTDAQGRYDQHVVLKHGRAASTLTYQLRLGTARGAVLMPYAASAGVVNELVKDIDFTAREVRFSGVIRNVHATALPIAGAQVAISSPLIGDLCAATSQADGSYACSLNVLNVESFPVAYDVVGDWGRSQSAGSVAAGGTGGVTAASRDLTVAATTLRLRGTVTDAANAPLAGATVTAAGPNVVASTSATSDAAGAYELLVMIRAGVELETITFQLASGGQQTENTAVYQFAAGELNAFATDLSFAVRSFAFSGRVVNQLAPAMALRPMVVSISSPTLGALCATTSGQGAGAYSCTAQVNTRDPFVVEYRLSGDWGSAVVTRTVATLPPVGGLVGVEQELAIRPTTLLLRGTVRDGANLPLAGIQAGVASSGLLSAVNLDLSTLSAANGAYTLPLVLRQGVDAGDLSYQFRRDSLTIGATRGFSAAAGALTEVVQDATIAERELVFSGSVRNALVPGQKLGAAQIDIRSPQAGLLCRWTPSGAGGSDYMCRASVASTEAISLTYTVTGDWGGLTFNSVAPAGAFGSSQPVIQDLSATPTTLMLTGKVTDSQGNGLFGVVVSASSDDMSRSAHAGGASGATDASGNYRIALVLDGLAEFGEVRYNARRGSIALLATAPFSATYHQLTEVKQDLSFSQRGIRFQGPVRNDLAGGRPVGVTQVAVSSPLLGDLCSFTPLPGAPASAYTCDAQVATTAAFSVTYTVSGDWGTEVLTGTAAAGATGSSSTLSRALLVRPATLRLTGTVSDPANRRLSSALVRVSGAALSAENIGLSGSTNAEGDYEIYAVLVSGALSGTLDYAITANSGTVIASGPFAGAAGRLSQVEQNLLFSARSAQFSGAIKHALLPWMSLQASSVTINDAQGARLCAWDGQGGLSSTYACTATLASTETVSTTTVVAGPWGSESLPGQVAAGDYASSTRVARDLLVTPATLRLRGVARNAGGAPLPDVAIEISGPGLLSTAKTTTLANGEYEVFALLRPNGSSGALSYKATYQAVEMTASASYAAAPRAITAVSQDFAFSSRRVDFSGQVKSALVTGMAVNAESVVIAAPDHGTLCEWHRPIWGGATSLYACSATVFTTAAVSVTYTISGDWGVQVVSGLIPAGAMGGLTSLTRELPVSPRTLRVDGTVKDADGAPLANARVVVSSPSFSTANPGYEVRSDASGAYRLDLVLKANAGQGTVGYRVFYNAVELQASAAFTAAAGQLTTLSQPFTVTQRLLKFAGPLRHALVPGMAVKARQVRVSSPTLGELCVDTNTLPADSYDCSVQVDTTEPFSLTYTVSGDWGTQVISGASATTFPALGGSFTLNRQLDLAPTTLHLTGTVRREDAAPLANVRVEVGSPTLVLENGITAADTTDAAGGYDFYVLLKDGAISDTLTYSVTQSIGTAVETAPFSAAAGQVTALERSFVYNARYVQFAGAIGNALAPGQAVWATRVEVSSPTLGRLCVWSGPAGPNYLCAANIRSSEPFSVTYAISGDWGSAVVTRTQAITPPAPGTRLNDSFALAVAPTTLHLRGQLRDPQGQPLAGATVRIYGLNQFSRNEFYIDAATGADGRYSAYAALKSGVLSGTLDYQVTFGTVQRTERGGFSAAAGQLAAVERDITLSERRLEFTGAVANALVPGMAAPITALDVRDGGRKLCSWRSSLAADAYACTATLTTTDALNITYVVTGTWGGAVLPGARIDAIPAVGATATVDADLAVTPATVHLTGVVRGPNGAALGDSWLEIGSAGFAPDRASGQFAYVSGLTDAAGVYHLYALARAGSSGGALEYYVTSGSATKLIAGAFGPVAPGQLATVSRDLTFDVRSVNIEGAVVNALLPGQNEPVYASAITVTDALGAVLCETVGDYFWCAGATTLLGGFTATARAAGPWGETTYTFSVPAGELGSQVTVSPIIPVAPTTVRVRGVVRNSLGQPLGFAQVQIGGPDVPNPVRVNVNEQGAYTAYVVVAKESGAFTIRTSRSGGTAHTASVPFAAAPGALGELTHDVTFAE